MPRESFSVKENPEMNDPKLKVSVYTYICTTWRYLLRSSGRSHAQNHPIQACTSSSENTSLHSNRSMYSPISTNSTQSMIFSASFSSSSSFAKPSPSFPCASSSLVNQPHHTPTPQTSHHPSSPQLLLLPPFSPPRPNSSDFSIIYPKSHSTASLPPLHLSIDS